MTKYYAVPFISGGITLRLDVTAGYVSSYVSDTIRKPGQDCCTWLINTRGYADRFIDQAQFDRFGTRHLYVALTGFESYSPNTYLLNSTSGDFSSQGMQITINLQ